MIRNSSKTKNTQRIRRASKTRARIADSGNHRISIHRSIQHMYLQLISPSGDKVITTISTNQKDSKAKGNNIESAKGVATKMASLEPHNLIDQNMVLLASKFCFQ